MSDVLGSAILDYYQKNEPGRLWIHNTYGRKENMPLKIYFRGEKDMPKLELMALQRCKGKVLDIGAGAGSHALALQARGHDVTALDISAKACKVMKQRGVANVVKADINEFSEGSYDTILLLMNGIGLTGTLPGFSRFLANIKRLLAPKGQLLFDSSDVAYLFDGEIPVGPTYYGEINYRYEYKQHLTNWFKWLYVDKTTLKKIARQHAFKTRVLYEDEHAQYLVRLTL